MIDLKEIMDDRSTAPQDLMQHLRLSQVEQRIKIRRQRRVTVGSLASIVVLAILGYAVTSRPTAAPLPPAASPSPTAETTHGFPEYRDGRRLVAAAQSSILDRPITLTWTPTGWRTLLEVRCRKVPAGADARVNVEINGKPFHNDLETCNLGIFSDQEALSKVGVKLGEPSTVKVTFVDMRITPTTESSGVNYWSIDGSTTVAVAIWNEVPFADYPFPERPATLKPLKTLRACSESEPTPGPITNLVSSDPADPARPMSMKVTWRGSYTFLAQALTTGHLKYSVNGVEVGKNTWWGYDGETASGDWETADTKSYAWQKPGWVHPRQGEQVTVTITPENITGAWQFRLAPYQNGNLCERE